MKCISIYFQLSLQQALIMRLSSLSQFRPKDWRAEVLVRGTLDIVQAKVGTMGKVESERSMLA